MEIDILAFPWTKFKSFADEGKLSDQRFQYSDEYANLWRDSPRFSEQSVDSEEVGNSFYGYQLVCDDCSSFRHLGFDGDHPFMRFYPHLINDRFETDLEVEDYDDGVLSIISPDRVKQLAEIGSTIDFEEIAKAHQQLDPEGEGEISHEEFVAYIKILRDFVIETSENPDSCLVIKVS